MPKRVAAPLSDEELAALDAARGEISRAMYVRRLILEALFGEPITVLEINPEDWRKTRGL